MEKLNRINDCWWTGTVRKLWREGLAISWLEKEEETSHLFR